jgi:hypothetical protein
MLLPPPRALPVAPVRACGSQDRRDSWMTNARFDTEVERNDQKRKSWIWTSLGRQGFVPTWTKTHPL